MHTPVNPSFTIKWRLRGSKLFRNVSWCHLLPDVVSKTAGWMANSVDPDATPRSVASPLGLHYLLRHVCLRTYGKYGNLWYESQRERTYRLKYAPNDDSNQPAHSHSLISLSCPQEETLHQWLSKMQQVKILIRLRESAGWSESS